MGGTALGVDTLDLAAIRGLQDSGKAAFLGEGCRNPLRASRKVVEDAIASGGTHYGINTGFGKLAGVRIEAAKLGLLQRNLLLSHATGVGVPLRREIARIALCLRIHNLALGSSGVRTELLELMIALLNADLIPVIPSLGSVGASGDLAPLAHMALPLLGYGEVDDGTQVISGADALSRIGREPIELAEKEGLALINGTQIMTALGLSFLLRAHNLSVCADITCAMTVEALRGSERPFMSGVHDVRPHPGQRVTAQNLRMLLADSKVIPSHVDCEKVQDAYSLRCAPQVHGASKDALAHAERVLLIEANSVTDNPLVFADGTIVSAGNFHGQPVSQALDFAKIGVATLANISERRIENLVNPDISGLPPFLADDPGVESGFMIPQVVAAALASENKTLAHPSSVDTIPTSANREDHVSMGVTAARHGWNVLENAEKVLGIELLCAAQGLEFGGGVAPGRGVAAAHAAVRTRVPALHGDRYLAPDLAVAEDIIASGALRRSVESEVGSLLET